MNKKKLTNEYNCYIASVHINKLPYQRLGSPCGSLPNLAPSLMLGRDLGASGWPKHQVTVARGC